MALFTMMCLSAYTRPGELLRCRVANLIKPSPGVTETWSLLLNPEEYLQRSKTGEFDDSLSLDSPYMKHWAPPLMQQLTSRNKHLPLWSFDYGHYSHIFALVTKPLHQSLLAPAQRSKHRPKSRTAVLAGGAKEGQVEKLQECGSLREVSQTGLQLPAAQPEAPTTLPSRRDTARGSDVWQGPSSAPSLKKKGAKGQYVADFFAGSGGLAHQCRRLGYRAKEWEISRGPQFDLTKPQVLRCIRRDINKRLVLAAILAPPDSSFSAARDRHSVLRTQQYPWGLPNHLLSSADQLRVENGNKCFAAALKIISWLDQHHIPWILENPSSSKCWYLPDLQQLMHAPHCVTVLTDSCQFGTKWRKRSRLLCGHLDSQDVARLERLCAGRGLCSQTGSKHFQLTGSNHQGIPWTRIAEPYAKGLCQQLAFVLTCTTHYNFNPL